MPPQGRGQPAAAWAAASGQLQVRLTVQHHCPVGEEKQVEPSGVQSKEMVERVREWPEGVLEAWGRRERPVLRQL